MRIKKLIIIFILASIFSNSYIGAKEILFNWLGHISEIQEEWIRVEKEAFSIWNNITRFQDFESLRGKISELNVSIHKMREVHDRDLGRYSKQYPEFFELSSNYLTSLEKAVLQLEHILDRLNDKTKDINSYQWQEYKNDINKYNKLVDDYHSNGDKMNKAYGQIE